MSQCNLKTVGLTFFIFYLATVSFMFYSLKRTPTLRNFVASDNDQAFKRKQVQKLMEELEKIDLQEYDENNIIEIMQDEQNNKDWREDSYDSINNSLLRHNMLANDTVRCEQANDSYVNKRCLFDPFDTEFRHINNKVFFLPAFYDDRKPSETYFRILALLPGSPLSKLRTPPPIYCRIILCNNTEIVLSALLYPFNENLGRYYGGYIVSCPLQNLNITMFQNFCELTLSLSGTQSNTSASVTLPVMTWRNEEPQKSFALCIPPLFGNVTAERLIEFIEFHRLLGVDHLYFYNYTGSGQEYVSIKRNISDVLNYYSKLGLVTTYQWRLPIEESLVRYYGQLTTVHHCLYTAMFRYTYVAFNDIDEYIIPRWQNVTNWSDLLALVDNDRHCGFRFYSSFFQHDNNANTSVSDPVTMTWLFRYGDIHQKRTKCIVRPERMFEMGVHHMSKWNEEHWTPKDVEASVALVHHYRSCVEDYIHSKNCKQTSTDDFTLRYKKVFLNNYYYVYRKLFDQI